MGHFRMRRRIAGRAVEVLESRTLLSAHAGAGFKVSPLNPAGVHGATTDLSTGRTGVVQAAAPWGRALQQVPGDPNYGSLWGMGKIQAPAAWDRTTGSRGVVVADIDSGMDYAHPDLFANVWLNQAEIPAARLASIKSDPAWDVDGDGLVTFRDLNDPRNQGTGKITDVNVDGRIDAPDVLAAYGADGTGGWADGVNQDGNSYSYVSGGTTRTYQYVDDLVGWNFAANNNKPFDGGSANGGHGTHTAGTIAAAGNNGAGVAGVNWSAEVMPLKIFNDSGTGIADVQIANAFRYSADMGARAANCSWGGTGGVTNDALYNAISYARQKGELVVASAGNGDFFGRAINNDTSRSRVYPASYALDNIISVAATSQGDAKASFSNYGKTSVDLGAPGVGILSTKPNNTYGSYDGTSMAAPHVTGVAALAWSLNPALTATQVRSYIFNGVDAVSSLAVGGSTPVATGGRLNAFKTLQQIPVTVPASPSGLGGAAVSSSRVDLHWNDVIGETGYTVERSDDARAYATIATLGANVTTLADTVPTSTTTGRTFTYRVTATNGAGPSVPSAPASVSTLVLVVPAAPTDLAVTNSDSLGSPWTSRLFLSWSDAGGGETGFKVRRSTSLSFATYSEVQIPVTGGATTFNYVDGADALAPLPAGTTFYYQVVAFNGSADSDPTAVMSAQTQAEYQIPAPGTGLLGQYYSDQTFGTLRSPAGYTDAQVNKNWGSGAPAFSGMPTNNFTVRWTGQVLPTLDESYTFGARTDDDVRLWIADADDPAHPTLLVNVWPADNTSEWRSNPIPLRAGHRYDIQMDFKENAGGASAYLYWWSPSHPRNTSNPELSLIPQANLFGSTTAPVYTTARTDTVGTWVR